MKVLNHVCSYASAFLDHVYHLPIWCQHALLGSLSVDAISLEEKIPKVEFSRIYFLLYLVVVACLIVVLVRMTKHLFSSRKSSSLQISCEFSLPWMRCIFLQLRSSISTGTNILVAYASMKGISSMSEWVMVMYTQRTCGISFTHIPLDPSNPVLRHFNRTRLVISTLFLV